MSLSHDRKNLSGPAGAWTALGGAVTALLCCVLPSLLVLAGLGTTVAAATSSLPWLVVLSRHKGLVFLAAGGLIVGSRVYETWISPALSADGSACPTVLGSWTRRIWWASVFLYGVGLVAVYVVGPLLLRTAG